MHSVKERQYSILNSILELPDDWHGAGSFNNQTLKGIFKHCAHLDLTHTLETGSGKSTLLFSHLSQDHKVFALDGGSGSVTKMLESPLLNRQSIQFVDGPTQKTLPSYAFDHKVQVALIDGPHAYPFPDLEYYYIYPWIETDGILILDDIDIPMIHNIFLFLKSDSMFSLIEVIEKTAFFRRTNAPTFDPFGDGWWAQNYNAKQLDVKYPLLGPILKPLIPKVVRSKLRSWLHLK